MDTIGILHTHPRGGNGDNLLNPYFGPQDLRAGQDAFGNIRKVRTVQDYLSGSDGVLKVIRNPQAFPFDVHSNQGSGVPHSAYDIVNPNVVLRLPK